MYTISSSFNLLIQNTISSFSRDTSSLSVIKEYLGLDNGLPIFSQNFKVVRPTLLLQQSFIFYGTITLYG